MPNTSPLRLTLIGAVIIATSYGVGRYTHGLFVPVFRREPGIPLDVLG